MLLPRAALLIAFGLAVVFGYPDDYNQRHVANDSQIAIFCYVNGTRILASQSRQSYQLSNLFNIEDVKTAAQLCTHIVYGGAVLDPSTKGIRAMDQDLEQSRGGSTKISFETITELARTNRNLKVLISISGSPEDFKSMARNNREVFIRSVMTFLSKYKFDGINIDWQYPGRGKNQDHGSQDKQNFSQLMQELKLSLRTMAGLLTASLPQYKSNVVDGYDYTNSVMMESVDYWFIMATEYYGHFSNRIDGNAPIKSRQGHDVTHTIDDLKNIFMHQSYKLILIVPFYGKTYRLKEELRGDESPIDKNFLKTHPPTESVMMTYREVCQKVNMESGWRHGFDEYAKTAYVVKDGRATLYEDARSVRAKTDLALREKLGGVMAFSLDMDDYDGNCASGESRRPTGDGYYDNGGREQGSRAYPLLRAMSDRVKQGATDAATTGVASIGLLLASLLLLARG